tara:strand:+ start:400 stop:1014 length:615 start_codon:yes stop_codon:yes gene_type:complete
MDLLENSFNEQRRIGLTGGIASGKTTIANYINKIKNITLLDADQYSKELTAPGKEPYKQIILRFGQSITKKSSPEKEINRSLLKKIIFDSPEKRIWLENYLHPLIKEKFIQDFEKYKEQKTLLLIIPLLFEAQFQDLCTEIWVVKCSKETQLKRLINRDKINEKEAKKIISTQLNLSNRINEVNLTINNEDNKYIWQKLINEII